jgi:hypothetical protein
VSTQSFAPATFCFTPSIKSNVLITSERRACIVDFGLATVEERQNFKSTRFNTGRWQAPELLRNKDADQSNLRTSADIYAFSCLCIEVYTPGPFRIVFALNFERARCLRLSRRLRNYPQTMKSPSLFWEANGLHDQIQHYQELGVWMTLCGILSLIAGLPQPPSDPLPLRLLNAFELGSWPTLGE